MTDFTGEYFNKVYNDLASKYEKLLEENKGLKKAVNKLTDKLEEIRTVFDKEYKDD